LARSAPDSEHPISSSGADQVDESLKEKEIPGSQIRTELLPDVESKVIHAVVSVKRLARDQVSIDSSLADLGYDSLDTINLLFELEEEFKVSVPDDQARQVRTVREIVNGVEKLLAERAADSSAA
jgi:acyl carrier protein